MLLVVSFDTVFFSIIAFWHSDNLGSIIQAGLISKGVFTGFYSLIFYIYLKFFDLSKPLTRVFKIKDVFQPLTYKQKFESAEKVIQETTEMYRILTEHSNDMVFLHEPNSTFRYVSPSIKKLLGYEQSEFIGKQVFSVVHKEDLKFLKEVLTKKMFSKGIVSDAIPLRIRHKQGHFIWLEFSSSRVYKADKISYFVTSARDITQRVLAKNKIEDALKELEKKEHSLSEASKVAKIGYWEYDIVTDTFTWSDYMYTIYGIDPKDGIPTQKELISFYDKESQEKIEQVIKEIAVKGVSCDVELKFINLQNEVVWERTVAKSIYNEQNEVIGRVGVMQNITASKKAQLELELSRKKMQTSLELLEKKSYALDEVSKMAKIGYWEYSNEHVNFIWSDYHYEIFGLDPKKGIPPREEIVEFFDKESQEKILSANTDLGLKGNSYDIELKLINKNKEEIWVRNIVQPVYNNQNKIIGRRGLLQNITASKKAELALKLSKENIQISLEMLEKKDYSLHESSKMAKIGYWEYVIATDTYTWSDYVYQMYGLTPNDGVPPHKEAIKVCDKESLDRLLQATLELNTKGTPYNVVLKLINRKKEEVWVRNVAKPIYNKQNEIIGRRGVLQNITEWKKAQLELELSKQKIQSSLDLLEKKDYSLTESSRVAKIGYWEYDIATDSFTWSDYVYEIYGFSPQDSIPSRKSMVAFYGKDSQAKLEQATTDLTLNRTPYDIELKLINNKNKEVWVRQVVQLIYNEQNEIIGRRGLVNNITAAKNAQIELEISKEKIQTSLKLSRKRKHSMNEASKVAKIGYWEHDMLKGTAVWSDYVHHIFGTNPKDGVLPEVALFKRMNKKSQEKFVEATRKLTANGVSYDLELKFTNLKDQIIWVRNVAQPIYNKQNEIVGKRGVLQNITDSKKVQQELEQSKQKIENTLKLLEKKEYSLRKASEIAKIGYQEYDSLTDTFIWSDHVYDILRFDRDKGVPSREDIRGIFDDASLEKYEKAIQELILNGTPFDHELKFITHNKEEVWVRNVVQPVYNKQNEIIGRRGVFQDITERKQIEKQHLVITERYRNLFDNAAVSVWNGDLTAVIEQLDQLRKLKIPNLKIYLEEQPEVLFSILDKVVINKVNKATVKLFKAKSEKDFLDGKIQNTFGSGVHNVFVDFIVSVWNKEKTFTSEVNYKTLKGDEFAALLSIPIPQNLIEQKTVPVSIQSVQSIKDAELEKRESLNRLKEAQELAQVGSWSFKFLTKESEWSDEMFRIWGFNISKTAPEESTILGRVHKEDQEFFKNVLSLAYDKGIPYDVEFRISLPNNVEKTTRSICRPVYSKNGELIGLKGTSQDITEQKRIRKEIEKAEEMYRILTDNSNDLICLQEPDSTFRYISPSIKNLLGYDQLDFLGKQVFSIVHEDDIQELKLAMKEKLFNDFNVEAFSFRVLHKDGHFVWLEFLSSPIYKNNEISYYVTSARDITQWVLAKQKIEEYQTSLQKLTTEMTLIEEKQKKEIATNIHDHLSQSLVISKMKINELKKRPQLKMIDEDLIFIETHISEALENSRKIMYELSPPVLYQLGIIEALNWLFDNVETTHKVACVVNSEVDSVKLDEATSILLYRSIQEVLTNAIKYANASLITLDLDKNKHGLDIFITDNGIGFNTDILNNLHNHSGSGFGLFTVQERIRNIQGKFTIQSKINTGTTVKIFIPLS
nr:PAS domain-containing protein [Polaribacter atrinae]